LIISSKKKRYVIRTSTIKRKMQTKKGSVDFQYIFCDYFLINAADF
jgi:hypothetical protein